MLELTSRSGGKVSKKSTALRLAPVTGVIATLALAGCSVGPGPGPGSAPEQGACSKLTSPVYQRADPRDQSSYVTTSAEEALAATKKGYTQYISRSFQVSPDVRDGLVPVQRLYRKSTNDYLLTIDQKEIAAARADQAYQDQGVAFYAAPTSSECLVAVHRYHLRGQHRLVVNAAERSRLNQAGWRDEGTKFYAAESTGGFDPTAPVPAEDTATKFSFAVVPPTEQEVLRAGDRRFQDRSVWLVENQAALNLKFVTHTGDVVNWDTPDHVQYQRARSGLKPLEAAGIPYSLALGNHDTAAACPEEDTCHGRKQGKAFRDTRTINKYFTAKQYGDVKGQFDKAKIDNLYAVHEAGGLQWLVLTLEMSPRPEVVKWAAGVVAQHPDTNVVVVTHTYLSSSGKIDTFASNYGGTSPRYLYDNLIKKYANVRLVFSSHVGGATDRVDTGVHGNKIYTFLHHVHDPTRNPLRLVEVDTARKSLKTRVYAPNTNWTWERTQKTISGISWVR